MKRIAAIVLAAVLVCVFPSLRCRAEDSRAFFDEQLEASGATALFESLPPHTRRLLDTLGIDSLSLEALTALQPQTVLSSLWDLLSEEAAGPLAAVASLLGLILLSGLFTALQPQGGAQAELYRILSFLAAVTPLLIPLWKTLMRAAEAAESAAVFSLGFAPVYASALASQGMALSAVSHQTLMLAAAQGISLLTQTVIMPLLCAALALGLSGAVSRGSHLAQVGTFVNKAAVWLLGLSLTVFVGLLSFQGVLTASADSVGGRVMRFSVAGLVPVVGGSLSEALYTVRGCLSALKGTVGAFGIFGTVLIAVPTLIECAVWSVLLNIAGLAAELFSFGTLGAAIETARGIVRTLIAVLSSSALLMIVAVTLTTITVGGG